MSQRHRHAWRQWLVGLGIPWLVGLGLLLGGLWVEDRTHLVARALGGFLLERNSGRPARGAVWEGILASRQARSHLKTLPPQSGPRRGALPAPVLSGKYWAERRSFDEVQLRRRRRERPLSPAELRSRPVQELARQLQVYQQGKSLLAAGALAREPFLTQARRRADAALADGSLFPLLYRRLPTDTPLALWDSASPPPEQGEYWQQVLGQVLQPTGTDSAAVPFQAAEAARSLVSAWADSLAAAELGRLGTAWEKGRDCRLHLVRTGATVIVHAAVASGLPVRLTLPPDRAQALFLGAAASAEPR